MTTWILALAVAVVVIGTAVYNSLVRKRNNVRNAWAQIDVQLKRRHDLVPNLVEAAKGYMQHEREVLERLTQARTQATAAGDQRAFRLGAENILTAALRSMLMVVEAYPALKASQNMLLVQEELTSTENRIAFARQFFNDSVAEYNTSCGKFPADLFAGAFGFHPEEFFHVELASERDAPAVKV